MAATQCASRTERNRVSPTPCQAGSQERRTRRTLFCAPVRAVALAASGLMSTHRNTADSLSQIPPSVPPSPYSMHCSAEFGPRRQKRSHCRICVSTEFGIPLSEQKGHPISRQIRALLALNCSASFSSASSKTNVSSLASNQRQLSRGAERYRPAHRCFRNQHASDAKDLESEAYKLTRKRVHCGRLGCKCNWSE